MLLVHPKPDTRGSVPIRLMVCDSWPEFKGKFPSRKEDSYRLVIRDKPHGMKGYDHARVPGPVAEQMIEEGKAFEFPEEYFDLAISMMKLDRAIREGNLSQSQAGSMRLAIRSKMVVLLKAGKWIEDPHWISEDHPNKVQVFLNGLRQIDLGRQRDYVTYQAVEQAGGYIRDKWYKTRANNLGLDPHQYWIDRLSPQKLWAWSFENKKFEDYERRFPGNFRQIIMLKNNAGFLSDEETMEMLRDLRELGV